MSDALRKRIENGDHIAFYEPLMTRRELATQLNVCVRTIDSWTKHRRIPSFKLGRLTRYSLPDVLASLRQFERKAIGQ